MSKNNTLAAFTLFILFTLSFKSYSQTQWVYEKKVDEMSDVTTFFAKIKSTNSIDFKFPYDGGCNFILCIREIGNGYEVLLAGTKCQFNGGSCSDEKLRIRFDEEPMESYDIGSLKNGSHNMIFICNPADFVNKILKCKKLRIEAPFFQEGRKIVRFNAKGLDLTKLM